MVMLNYTLDEMNEVMHRKLKIEDYDRLSLKCGLDLDHGESALNFELTSDRVDVVSRYSLASIFASQLGINIKRHLLIGRKNPGVAVDYTSRRFVNVIYVNLDGNIRDKIDELIAIQERLDKNVGRNRRKAAIGLFDYSKISFPIKYHEVDSNQINFIPLEYQSSMDYASIMKELKQSKEYGNLSGKKPIVWSDKTGRILAMPPIINADSYSITKDTKELLIDITGTDKETVNAVTKILIYNLQFIGSVSLVKVNYTSKEIATKLSLETHSFHLTEEVVRSLLGTSVKKDSIRRILLSMDYTVIQSGKDLIVRPPFYRQDVMHQVDIIDDIMRNIGVDSIKDIVPHSYTEGGFLLNHYTLQNIREILVGFGYQEIDINALTNEKYQFDKTFINGQDYVSLLPLKSGEVTMVSKNLFPELLRLISNNLHKKFPQNIFSLSEVVEKGNSDVIFSNKTKLSVVSCQKDANVTDVLSIIKKVLADAFPLNDLSTDYIEEGFSKTFITGRAYTLYMNGKPVGFAGEIHPRALNAFGIELPTAIAEIYVDGL